MKKYIFYFFAFLFIACSSNSNEIQEDPLEAFYREAIIGSWAINTITINGQMTQYEHTEGCEKDLFQFYNQVEKPFEFEERVVTNCPQCAECAITQTSLRWELKGNKIDFYFGDLYILQYEIIDVNDTSFSYRFRFDLNQDGSEDEVLVNADYYDPYNEFN